MALRLVSLDLDGTLIHPAIFNAVADEMGFGEALQASYQAYLDGTMSLEEAFHHDYKHFVGRSVPEMRRVLRDTRAWTPGIGDAVARLKEAGLHIIVTTDQPRFLAEATRELFGVEELVCTEAEVIHDRVTGSVEPAFEKWPNLERYLRAKRIDAKDVAHIGNGTNDIPVFERVGYSIGVNALHDSVNRAAKASIAPKMDDLGQAADLILAWHGRA